jgi:hypothetical protein
MNERTLTKRIAVMVIAAILTVIGVTATVAAVADDPASAAPRNSSEYPGKSPFEP